MVQCWIIAVWMMTFGWEDDDETYNQWILMVVEGSLEVKLPTICTDEKQSRAEAERRGRLEERRSEEKE